MYKSKNASLHEYLSSLSQNKIYSPLASFNAIFLAYPQPLFVEISIIFIRVSFKAYFFKIASELSVEPSFTQITSISLNV